METSHSPLPKSSVQSWGVARLCLSWDTCRSESPMAGSGPKSSGVRGRSLTSGHAPECPVQGAHVSTVELLRLSVQVRCTSGFSLCVHSLQAKQEIWFFWNPVCLYQCTQMSGSWQMAPLSVRGRWRWTFLDDGEHSVPPTGVWPMPMLSVVSSAVVSPSPPQMEQKVVINSGKPDFTAQGLSPSYGNALWLPWVFLTVPMATQPLWSAQVRQGRATVLRKLLGWNFPRAESKGKQALKGRYSVVKLLNSGFLCLLLKNPTLRDKRGVNLKIALLRKPAVLRRQRTNVPKNQLLLADQGWMFLNGNVKSSQVESGTGYLQNSTASSDNHLEIGLISVTFIVWNAVNHQF